MAAVALNLAGEIPEEEEKKRSGFTEQQQFHTHSTYRHDEDRKIQQLKK